MWQQRTFAQPVWLAPQIDLEWSLVWSDKSLNGALIFPLHIILEGRLGVLS